MVQVLDLSIVRILSFVNSLEGYYEVIKLGRPSVLK